MTSTNEMVAAIDNIIAARKKQIPALQAERSRVAEQLATLDALRGRIDVLFEMGGDESVLEEVAEVRGTLDGLASELSDYCVALDELKAEFTRDTLNIGVSGTARTGKSTTLQHITGLTDTQIPSGGLNPVTAVRSEIYNSPRNEAVITFKTKQAFLDGYVRTHIGNVNEYLPVGEKLSIDTLSELRVVKLPEKLEGAPDIAATDSLKRLAEAKRSIDTYEHLLGSSPSRISLDDVRAYVTYPNPEAEQAELADGPAADRRYLAIELAQVFCQFPNLGDAKVGLVDLPGLGEIGNSAAEIHLKGLEDKVDQIFLVMMPSEKKAFTDAEVGLNLDQLRTIQPAVRRGDLIVAGINRDEAAGQAAVENLRAHFEAEVNKGRTDCYSVIDYCAIDDGDVARMFSILLKRLGELLPQMDCQKINHCMGSLNLAASIAAAADSIVRSMDRILRGIPSSDRVMKDRINAIERAVIGSLSNYSIELAQAAQADSEVFKAFLADAQAIHDEAAARIEDGLFRNSAEEWDEITSSSKDYYNLYRDECKRIRYEIIDAYCGLDRFYGQHLSNFKQRVLDTVLTSCGMDRYFSFPATLSANERIGKVASELGSTLHDDDFDGALRLLSNVKFDFRSNVFLQIEGHLSELANPDEHFLGYESKREVLGGEGMSAHKQEEMAKYLKHDADTANDAILEALKSEQDRFNKYLAVSIDFFNNCLFGKDEDNFKQVVIRGLIRRYKKWVLPDADDASKSPFGRIAQDIKESVQKLVEDATIPTASPFREGARNIDGLSVGQVYEGIVTDVVRKGAYVSFGRHTGFIPKGQFIHGRVNDARECTESSQTVRVKIIKLVPEEDKVILSVKRAS